MTPKNRYFWYCTACKENCNFESLSAFSICENCEYFIDNENPLKHFCKLKNTLIHNITTCTNFKCGNFDPQDDIVNELKIVRCDLEDCRPFDACANCTEPCGDSQAISFRNCDHCLFCPKHNDKPHEKNFCKLYNRVVALNSNCAFFYCKYRP